MSNFSVRTASDGSRVIAAVQQLGAYPHTVCEDLIRWAAQTPDATFSGRAPGRRSWQHA
jgi:hypothetical protein